METADRNLLGDIASNSRRIRRRIRTLFHKRAVAPKAITNIHQEAVEMVDMGLRVSTVFECRLTIDFATPICDIEAGLVTVR